MPYDLLNTRFFQYPLILINPELITFQEIHSIHILVEKSLYCVLFSGLMLGVVRLPLCYRARPIIFSDK